MIKNSYVRLKIIITSFPFLFALGCTDAIPEFNDLFSRDTGGWAPVETQPPLAPSIQVEPDQYQHLMNMHVPSLQMAKVTAGAGIIKANPLPYFQLQPLAQPTPSVWDGFTLVPFWAQEKSLAGEMH